MRSPLRADEKYHFPAYQEDSKKLDKEFDRIKDGLQSAGLAGTDDASRSHNRREYEKKNLQRLKDLIAKYRTSDYLCGSNYAESELTRWNANLATPDAAIVKAKELQVKAEKGASAAFYFFNAAKGEQGTPDKDERREKAAKVMDEVGDLWSVTADACEEAGLLAMASAARSHVKFCRADSEQLRRANSLDRFSKRHSPDRSPSIEDHGAINGVIKSNWEIFK